MSEKFTYKTTGTCAKRIDIEMDGDKIVDVQFAGGCNGNTKGISSLVKGQTAEEIIERLEGIKCGFKDTSCPDQLAKALREIRQAA